MSPETVGVQGDAGTVRGVVPIHHFEREYALMRAEEDGGASTEWGRGLAGPTQREVRLEEGSATIQVVAGVETMQELPCPSQGPGLALHALDRARSVRT